MPKRKSTPRYSTESLTVEINPGSPILPHQDTTGAGQATPLAPQNLDAPKQTTPPLNLTIPNKDPRRSLLSSYDILAPDVIRLRIHLRKGQPLNQHRVTRNLPEPVVWEYRSDKDNYQSLCSQVRGYIASLQGLEWPADAQLYLKPSHTSAHFSFIGLNPNNCNDQLIRVWRNEAWRLLRNPNSDDVIINIFVYLQNTAPRVSGAPTRTRAAAAAAAAAVAPAAESGGAPKPVTGARIREAHARIAEAIVEGRLDPLGPKTRAYLARKLASRDIPAPGAPIQFERSNTFLQMQFIDNQKKLENPDITDNQKKLEDPDIPEARTIKFKINGVWVPLEVDVKSLRKALGLPDMDLTRPGLFDNDDGRL
ncbi:hypothetical protein BGZ51_008689 [Haplosporangium sp. Z 767]|nr:hypothetical protein BGZ50_000511 [Haplosporangium sp. Z 11]KAF9190396.1 hypothetical protein BGZ51_008689 [Haplosporangium sp. Z 767]